MVVKNIIFDLSEVILMGYVGVEKIFQQKTGIAKELFMERKLEMNEKWCDLMRGKMTEEQYWEEFLAGVNWPTVNPEIMKRALRENMEKLVPGTLELIYELHGYKLILASDHVKECIEYILPRQKWIYGLFNARYFSYETGLLKGDPGCFQMILEEQGICADETIFIDDLQNNIRMAMAAGIDSIPFTTAGALKVELLERQIKLS